MNYDEARDFFLKRPEAEEDYPFGPGVAVYKISGKMFATLSDRSRSGAGANAEGDTPAQMNLKCDPDEAHALRDMYAAVVPGYHMNKKHWNTVILDGSIPQGQIELMIERSYALVVKGLKKATRQALELRHGEALYG